MGASKIKKSEKVRVAIYACDALSHLSDSLR
jgi:hypothetical protein